MKINLNLNLSEALLLRKNLAFNYPLVLYRRKPTRESNLERQNRSIIRIFHRLDRLIKSTEK